MDDEETEKVRLSIIDLFDSIIEAQKTNPEAVQLLIESEIEAEILRISNGDKERERKLRQYQWNIKKELRRIKDPVARMNKMAELFWAGVHKFYHVCTIELPKDTRDHPDG